MEIDHDKIDEAVLALMWLTLHDGCRAWKSFDWGATDRLYQKGFICDPANKVKSVVLTEEGLQKAEELFKVLFSITDPMGVDSDLLSGRVRLRYPLTLEATHVS